MNEYEIAALCLTVKNQVMQKFIKEAEEDKKKPKSHAEAKEFEEAEFSSQMMTEAALNLAGNFLIDINRMALALEAIAMNTTIQHHPV